MKTKCHHKGQQHLRYNLNKWVTKDTFKFINDIIEIFTLVQLMDTLGNINNAIGVVVYWIFNSNFEKELRLTRELLDLICYPFVGEENL